MKQYIDGNEWIETENGIATVGITLRAQQEIGDIVYVELPKVGREVVKGQEACVIESTKAAVDIQSPLSGIIVAVNEELSSNVGLINREPEKSGWLFKIKNANP